MSLKTGSRWSNWAWDKPVKAFIWRSSRICRPIGGLPPWFFEDSLPHLLLRNNSIVQGPSLRWLVEVFIQDWKSYEGWSQLTTQPGEEGARHSVILSLLVDHSLFVHPDQQDQRKTNLPASTVGSLPANVQVECLVDVIDDLVSSDDPQEKMKRFTNALHEVFAFGSSKKHMSQRQLGRLEPTPALKYRADEVMRTMPVMST